MLNESLPVICGTGFSARCDWGAVYTMVRVAVIPLLSVIHVLATIADVALRRRRVVEIFSIALSGAVIWLQYGYAGMLFVR
jgi:hypothetical protein